MVILYLDMICDFLISDSRALIGQFLQLLGDELGPIGNREQRARVRWWRPLGYSTFSGNDGGSLTTICTRFRLEWE